MVLRVGVEVGVGIGVCVVGEACDACDDAGEDEDEVF